VTSRFSRADLFTPLFIPVWMLHQHYAPPSSRRPRDSSYRIVAFESADGVILLTGRDTSVRVAATDIASRQPAIVP